jgi:hypothetical protein
VLQLSDADAVPNAASIVGGFGLPHMNNVVPVAVITGTCVSSVHVTVLDVLAVLPHASMIVHNLVCERLHPVLDIGPSDCVTVGVLHASVDVALPNAASKAAADGLHPAFVAVPFANIETVLSNVHVTVRDVVDVLPQPSLAVNVLVCVRLQLLLCKAPSLNVSVTGPQASVAVAVPSAAAISDVTGLHPRVNDVPAALIVGGIRSAVHETVFDTVDVLPHASIAVNVLVCDDIQPVFVIIPSTDEIVATLQASVAVALPKAILIADEVGLHPSVVLL